MQVYGSAHGHWCQTGCIMCSNYTVHDLQIGCLTHPNPKPHMHCCIIIHILVCAVQCAVQSPEPRQSAHRPQESIDCVYFIKSSRLNTWESSPLPYLKDRGLEWAGHSRDAPPHIVFPVSISSTKESLMDH